MSLDCDESCFEAISCHGRHHEISPRNMLAAAAASAAVLLGAEPRVALASHEDVLTPLYFGVGVCWYTSQLCIAISTFEPHPDSFSFLSR
jgi:hypothetical protein